VKLRDREGRMLRSDIVSLREGIAVISMWHVWRVSVCRLAGCCLVVAAVISAAAQERAGTVTDATPPIDAIMRPRPLDPIVRRFYRNNPDCVSAKVDIWFGAGGYSHQLFTSKGLDRGADVSGQTPTTQETWEGEARNPETRQILDADSTTITVGRTGCRYRVRIERVD
jgi:hypothetical protein